MSESRWPILVLGEAILLGEQWVRSSDADVRRMGADLLQVLGADERPQIAPHVDAVWLAPRLRALLEEGEWREVDDESIMRAARAVIREVAHVRK